MKMTKTAKRFILTHYGSVLLLAVVASGMMQSWSSTPKQDTIAEAKQPPALIARK